jgi:hypothetical protein
MTPEQLEDLKAKGAEVVKDVNEKIRIANLKIEELRALEAGLKQLRQTVAAEKRANEIAAKHLKYAQLRLFKLIDEKNLDQSIKKLIDQAVEVPCA